MNKYTIVNFFRKLINLPAKRAYADDDALFKHAIELGEYKEGNYMCITMFDMKGLGLINDETRHRVKYEIGRWMSNLINKHDLTTFKTFDVNYICLESIIFHILHRLGCDSKYLSENKIAAKICMDIYKSWNERDTILETAIAKHTKE